jgi:thiol:disulfide interchange protein DsbA
MYKFYVKLLVGVILLFAFGLTASFAATYEEGEEYELVTPPQPTSTGDKIEVVELFWYGCPHCYQFEPYVQRWLKTKPANVEFVRIPAVFRPDWALFARTYYTAQVLGVVDKIHQPFFEAIHELRKPMKTEDQIAAFFAQHGVKKEDFHKVFRSFAVESKVRRAIDMTRRYGANGVPTMIVDGKYRTSATQSGSHANTLKVVDFLIKKIESNKK